MSAVLVIQIFVVIIVSGVFYNLWRTAQAYGGLIGGGLRWIGSGMIFFALEALDRVLGSLSFVNALSLANAELVHNFLLLIGLLFSAIGFSKLTKIAK